MRTVVELSEKDIIQTIANTYDVDVNKVVLDYKKFWVGHPMNEHEEHKVTAKVILNRGGADGGTKAD